jgi:hypothetical protein
VLPKYIVKFTMYTCRLNTIKVIYTYTLNNMSPANMFIDTDILSIELSCRWCLVSYPSNKQRLELNPAPASSAKLTSVKPSFWKLRPPFSSYTIQIIKIIFILPRRYFFIYEYFILCEQISEGYTGPIFRWTHWRSSYRRTRI